MSEAPRSLPEPAAPEQAATLQQCLVAPANPQAAALAAGWADRLTQLGLAIPLPIIHDLGWLLALPAEAARLRPGAASGLPEPLRQQYHALLRDVQASPQVQAASGLRLRDELVAVVLARLLGELSHRFARLPEPRAPIPAAEARRFLAFLVQPAQALHLLTAVELLDVDLLRLLAAASPREATARATLDSGDSGLGGPPELSELVDLLGAFDSIEVRDVVRFSLDLLPSVLETRRTAGSQHYPVGGFAAIERRGPLDSLLLSELAHDDDLFLARLSENELLYHGRERRHDEAQSEHHILIDASASMHGLRQVFARGLAIALAKKLSLLGGRVQFRFFDGRLHELVPLQPSLAAALPYLLSYRSSRGRHGARVFADLLRELQTRVRSSRGSAPSLSTYILTHGECHIPRATVQSLAGLSWLRGVFILPSGELDLDYLPLLRSTTVVTDEMLRQPETRRARALDIVAEASQSAARRAPGRP